MISKNAVLALAVCAAGTVNAFTTPLQTQQGTLSSLKMVSSSIPPEWQGSEYDPDRRIPLPPVAGSQEAGGLSLGKKDVMIPEDFTMARNVLAISVGLLAMYPNIIGVGACAFHLILGSLLYTQTNRVRVVMGKDSFEIFNLSGDGSALKEKPSNYVAGTVNRWTYDSIIDYQFFPSIDYPFIVFFKEVATDEEQWGNFGWWGKFASMFDPTRIPMVRHPEYKGLKSKEGQPHFMPGLFDVKEFAKQLEARGAKHL